MQAQLFSQDQSLFLKSNALKQFVITLSMQVVSGYDGLWDGDAYHEWDNSGGRGKRETTSFHYR